MCFIVCRRLGNLSIVGVFQLGPGNVGGKKVRLTPVNITPKCALVHDGCRVKPVKRGNQWVNPARMAKTAPIERT